MTPPVPSITDEQLAEIEMAAEAATGGEWEYRLGLIRTLPDSDGYVPVAVAPNSPKNWRGQRDRNMQYIAMAMPSAMLALITRLRAAEADARRYRLLRDGSDWPAVFASHDAPEPLRGADLDTAMERNP